MSIGTGQDFISTWKDKGIHDHCCKLGLLLPSPHHATVEIEQSLARSLSNYPLLNTYVETIVQKDGYEASTVHVALGPNGSFYINSSSGENRGGLDPRLDREIDRRISGGFWDHDPIHVTLGVDGSYVLLGKKGDIFWDLKGQYEDLDKALMGSKVGVKVSHFAVSLGTGHFKLNLIRS
jgi:hypothetical protein